MYSIIDIETTGGSPQRDKITEIAIYVFDGNEIVQEFVSLVNPERDIPYYITQLTGITNEMVADAPKFYEIAGEIIKHTEDHVFVAHNVGFDFGFIKNEFKELGYDFSREQLCTVRLSRRLIPGKKSYSLGKLCKELGISLTDRHRAAGDALATVKLFDMLLKCNGDDKPLSIYNVNEFTLKGLHKSINKELLQNLPESTGVYYFHNEQKETIYIGKSKNIKKRVMQHLNNTKSKRSIEMKNSIADISFELTGSELIALLKESEEIKGNKPKYNRAQRRTMPNYGLYHYIDKNGYERLKINKNTIDSCPVTTFNSGVEAKEFMNKAIDQYQLCQKLCGTYETDHSCFYYQIKQCKGACIGEESPNNYNKRVKQLLDKLHFGDDNFLIVDKGRKDEERSLVLVENGKYIGFGYMDIWDSFQSVDEMKDCISNYADNREIRQIIKLFLRKNKVEKVIDF